MIHIQPSDRALEYNTLEKYGERDKKRWRRFKPEKIDNLRLRRPKSVFFVIFSRSRAFSSLQLFFFSINVATMSERIAAFDEKSTQSIPEEVLYTDVPATEIKSAASFEQLSPPDGGRGWVIVAASFCGLFSIFGYNYSWGVFLNYYNRYVFVDQMPTLSWIGSICVALFFILGPINQLVIRKMGYKYMLATGTVLCSVALILASFATQVWHVFLTQGVLFGVGASFVWFPCIGAPQQWFSERRGLAVGIAMSGSGIGGLCVSNIAQAIIASLGYRWALRIIGIMCFALLSLATVFVRPLGTARQTGGHDKVINWYLFKNPQFTIMFLHGLITTFGYMTPFFLLPAHAASLGLSPWIGTNLSAIMSGVNAAARICTGYMGDKLGRFNSLFLCTFLAGVSCLTIWINVHNAATLWAFAALYGFFGGGYVALFPTVQPQVVGLEHISPAVGLLYFTNLFGYMFGTPIASALMRLSDPPDYRAGAIWAGCTVIVGALFAGWLRVKKAGWKLIRV
ncbi:major facilitator superfamily domain-containing protein [Radiomyces spectabilis]|uniref:major facilitator superfamily domain-containing protein n=1 Tax=Radiomyces spectabilis TaxID=64574 RepID=UPI00221E58B6|nr:major facilitator superfamily domain-containing protein [Radiomyces spectabilis]KAI8388112.1 major facilitator superfamily domain-containing protein [Radiomyces spectabilis]